MIIESKIELKNVRNLLNLHIYLCAQRFIVIKNACSEDNLNILQ